MSRFTTTLDTVRRTLIVIDTETDSKLTIQQKLSKNFVNKLLDDDECDGLVEFANDFSDDLTNSVLALELFGDSTITFEDKNWPQLTGGVYLKRCVISGAVLHNSSLTDVIATCADRFHISSTTIDSFEWPHGGNLSLFHCYVSDKYSSVRERATPAHNEWFMNNRVDNEMW